MFLPPLLFILFLQPISPQQRQSTIQSQHLKRDSVRLLYQHTHTYTFRLQGDQQFVITVNSEHTIKGAVNVYWDVEGTFTESDFREGETVRLLVYEDRQIVLVNEVFYQTTGFSFQAVKGKEYLLRFMTMGQNKLVIMTLENYVSDTKTEQAISNENIESHDKKARSIRSRMTSYLAVVEHNAFINEQISQRVYDQTRRYMAYQMLELFVVAIATITQIFFIKRLLRRDSIV